MKRTHKASDLETPFRIAILGDFSGRGNREVSEAVDKRRFQIVDRDNFDEVLAKLKVEVYLPILGKTTPPIRIRFSELDDFHPDRLFENIEVFEGLKETRQGLKDSSIFGSIVKKSQETQKRPSASGTPKDTEKLFQKISGEKTEGLLDQILEETAEEPSQRGLPRESSEWDNFLRGIVQPHLVPDVHQKQAERVASVDAAASELMRRILHHPDFQAIEAAWRALYFLVSRLETDSELKLYLLDITKEELAADLCTSRDLRSTGTYKLIVEQSVETLGEEPWAVLAGNYTFDYTREDAEVLARIAKIGKRAGAPFISATSDHLLGCKSLVETPDPDDWKRSAEKESLQAWKALKKLPEASYMGLALPRFLLRVPYGQDTEPIESFQFGEMEAKPVHSHYLWGNPSFACAYLIGQTFSVSGWKFQPGMIQDIEGLPVHIHREGGEPRMKPCAEVVLAERAVEEILGKGLMPLLSFKNQDRIRIARFQSFADPPTGLAGRWA